MIGTDIIDLKEARARSNWRRKGFLSKLFSTDEIEFIDKSDNREIAVWRLWSMKESAYKADFHKTGVRKFNPIKFKCKILDIDSGMVLINNRSYSTISKATDEFILSWTKYNYVKTFCKPIRTGRRDFKGISQFLYLRLKRDIAATVKTDPETVKIYKTREGVPKVFIQGHKADMFCSVSHHGEYGSLLFSY